MWSFCGNAFSWGTNGEEISISLEPSWHEFVPYVLSANPPFETNEAFEIMEKSLRVSIFDRDENDPISMINTSY